ncbi:MAG: TIGR03915 family putative DNA repair protein [Rectinemataceae bacterium]
MTVFRYDGGLPGLICATCELLNAVAAGQDPGDVTVSSDGAEAGLFEEVLIVNCDPARAERLVARLEGCIGVELPPLVRDAFASDLKGVDGAIARLIARLFREGSRVLDDLGDCDVRLVERAANRTRRAAQLMTGFLRFRELSDGSFVSIIEPDCDILPLIAGHFAARYPSLRWAIKDGRRDRAIVHEPGRGWTGGEALSISGKAAPSWRDGQVAEAWRGYFNIVGIEERTNPGLQASRLPKKYRKHMGEFDARAGKETG